MLARAFNRIHIKPASADADLDPSKGAEAASHLPEGNRLQAEVDVQRLSALIREVADSIGDVMVSVQNV